MSNDDTHEQAAQLVQGALNSWNNGTSIWAEFQDRVGFALHLGPPYDPPAKGTHAPEHDRIIEIIRSQMPSTLEARARSNALLRWLASAASAHAAQKLLLVGSDCSVKVEPDTLVKTYKIIYGHDAPDMDNIHAEIEKLAKFDGWELKGITSVPWANGNGATYHYYFGRPKMVL